MAGHYEAHYVWTINEDTGKRVRKTVWVWVPDKPKSRKAPTRSSAAAAARRAAQIAAARKRAATSAAAAKAAAAERAQQMAARQAYERRLAEARHASYEALKERQYELTRRAGVIKQQTQAAHPTSISGKKTDDRQQFSQEQQQYRASLAQKQQEAHLKDLAQQIRQRNAVTQAKAGDTRSAKELEAMLKQQAELARRSGTADTKYIGDLQKKFEEHAKAAYDRYERLVAQINAALAKGDIKKARTLYFGSGFKTAQAEFTRLFGNGKNPLKDGTYGQFYKQYQQIALDQRSWWKNQMKSALNSQLLRLEQLQRSTGEDFSDQIKQTRDQLNIFNEVNLGQTIDHYERWTSKDGKEHVRPVYRQKTLEEALNDQRAHIILKQQQIAAERAAQDKRQKALDLVEGNFRIGNQVVAKDQLPILKAAQAIYGDSLPPIRRPEDLQKVSDSIVQRWVEQHQPPNISDYEGAGRNPNYNKDYLGWKALKDDYEKQVYAFFGASAPGFLDRFMTVPGISHGLAILQGGVSGIGAGFRALNAAVFGESKIGGFQPDLGYLPRDFQLTLEHQREVWLKEHPGSGPRAETFLSQQRITAIKQWLQTPEGQKWQQDDVARQRIESGKQDLEFAGNFYGQGALGLNQDPGAALDALNKYGSEPFNSNAANLLFQLLADPTNAIPLNFTTYLARGKYALEAADKAKGLTKLTAKTTAFAKGFLTVDEGTLELRKAAQTVAKELEQKGLTVERAVQMLQERVVGITDKEAQKTILKDWMKAIGLDPRKVNESQLFNIVEYIATKEADHRGIKLLTQASEYNAKTEADIARAEAAQAAVKQRTEREAKKVSRSTERRVAQGEAARERLAIEHEAQVAALKEKAARSSEAAAAPEVRVKPPEPANNPNISGATDNRVAQTQTKAIQKQVRSKAPSYAAADEYFKTDPVGNRLPVNFVPDEDYRKLLDAARAGDADAAEQLVNRARYERNRFRMENEDLIVSGTRRRDLKFKPTKFDLAERAGTVSDEVATARLIADRKIVRKLKRVAAANEGADEWVRSFVRRERTKANRHPLVGAEDLDTRTVDEFGDLRSQTVQGRIAIGDDIISAREQSLRGVKDLYETFSHDATKYYPGLGGDLTKLTPLQFKKIVMRLTRADQIGAAAFRDGGQLLFEVFHQLRLAKKWDLLREYSDFMSVLIRDEPENIWGWMWKAMEERSVLPYSMHINDIRAGFYQAAESFNLHPELAFSTIPSGYYAQRLPISFGLSPRLQGLADSASDLFHTAPKGYTKEQAKSEVTRMFLGGSGEPTRVVHYVAERYGDFYKGGEVSVRMRDEMTHALGLAIGPEALAAVVMRHEDAISPALREFAERRGVPVEEFIRREITDQTRKWGRTTSRPRPEYPGFRDAVEKAYWAGDLPDLPARAHTMMLLSRLQTRPDAYVGALRTYMTYMTKLGGEDLTYAKSLVRQLYEGEIATDLTRRVSEELRGRTPYQDAISGASIITRDKSRIRLWEDFGLGPTHAQALAYAENRAKVAESLDQEFADQVERESWLTDDVAKPTDKYTGTYDDLDFHANFMAADERGKEALLRNFLARHLDSAGANWTADTAEQIKSLIDEIREDHGAMVARVQDDLGLVRLEEVMKSRRGDTRFIDAPDPKVPHPPEDEAPIPQTPASRSAAEEMYSRIFNMTETEWWAYEKQRANRVLTSSRASAERKIAARKRIKDIEAAEYIVRQEKKRGVYVPWKDRADFRDRVLSIHGAEVEGAVAPKMIAPLALSASDASVEQFRTYWRALQTAATTPVPSKVKGIRVRGQAVDHLPKRIWDDVEQRVSDAIAEARGYRADTRTRSRRKGLNQESQRPLGKMSDNDPIVIKAKQKALLDYAQQTGVHISIEAYDEARKVLWKGYVQDRTAKWLLARATKIVERSGGDLEAIFLRLREKEAKIEARRQLGSLAFGELYGHSPDSILAEFLNRYSNDGMLRSFTPELSAFQRATLEAHLKEISGLDVLDERVGSYLQSANMPPLSSRELTRDFLTRIGAWSPRTSEDFVRGARSWSVYDEAEYWRIAYGEVPEWTDHRALATEFNQIFHDESLYFAQMKAWGIFSRSQELQLKLDGVTAEEIEKAALEGNPNLGIKARRELELQRKYVIERYGSLVSKDGHTLDAMPWLMHPDEYRDYLARTPAKTLPEGLIQTAQELDEVTALIKKAMEPVWEKYVAPKVKAGEQVTYHDIFRVASEVQAQLLANPKWAARHRDLFGKGLNGWAKFQRWLVFSNPAFLVTNAVDAPIKTAYYRFTRRGLFNAELARDAKYAEAAMHLTPESLGLDATTAMYRIKQAGSLSRLKNPRGFTGVERAADRALALIDGTGELFPTIAGRVELSAKMSLARGMYPKVYREFEAALKNPELADAAAKNFIKKEVLRMWPTAGTGPIERLWNRIVPFSSYSVRNKVLFISEAVKHPALLNYIDRIGDYIEEENLKQWEKDHPGTEMPENLRRMVELPWAKGFFLDLSTFSDAARGLKPIFDADKPKTVRDQIAVWVRLVNPGVQAGVYALFNAFNVAQKQQWVAEIGPNGFPTGRYHLVTVGWNEPWSKDQADLGSVFWFADLIQNASEYSHDGWTAGEVNLMLGQALLFNGIKTYERGAVAASFYFNLRAKDPKAAAAWLLNTEDGHLASDWMETKAQEPKDWMDRLKDIERAGKDSSPFFHSLTPEQQATIKAARDRIKAIREGFAAQLATMEPGSAEYRETKARMYMAINNVYLNTPDLMIANVYGKTAAEWSQQLEDWQTDKLMDTYMQLSGARPLRSAYATAKEYNAAVAAWNLQKQTFLHQYPQVADRLNAGRTELDRVRDQVQKEWDAILGRISRRNEMIEAAKSILDKAGRDSAAGKAAQDRLDALYLANELDYSLLERDHAAVYFSPDDLEQLPDGVQGPARLKGNILARATLLLDFDRVRYEKALREGKLDEFLAQQQYGQDMKAAISYAKGGDPFGEFDGKRFFDYMQAHPGLRERYFSNNVGKEAQWTASAKYVEGIRAAVAAAKAHGSFDPAAFVRYMKAHPALLEAYFKRHPEKRALWGQTDQYIKLIGRWGQLARAGKWDAAAQAWDQLPKWVKDRYYAKHPERRQRAQQTATYLGYMKTWVGLFEKGDKTGAMKYFHSLPKWAQDRYYKAHPDKRAEFELTAKMSQKLVNYFAADKAAQAQYLAENPDLQAWLAQNGSASEKNRMAILAAYRSIPKEEQWLRKVFRDKYPEIFSKEAAGERKLKRVYDTLSAHPDVLPEFEKWVKAIWDTYAEMLKHPVRPLSSYFHTDRKVPARKYRKSLSAAEASNLI